MTTPTSATERRPKYNLTLTDTSNVTVGLSLCDTGGKESMKGIAESGMPRTALKTTQGDPQYSDFELPYTPMTQKSWVGGRGQKNIETDSTRFFDSNNIDSSGEYLMLGPKATECTVAGAVGQHIMFDYKGARYAIFRPDTGGTPKLYINGLRGVAISNAGHLDMTKTTLNLSTTNLSGCTIVITGGLGSAEMPNYRTIIGNTMSANADIYVLTPWLVTQDTTTEFVILGLDTWTEITGHGLAGPVTDVCNCNDMVYVAQGESVNIRRMKEYNDSGTWRTFGYGATTTNDDGTNKATFLKFANTSTGLPRMWKFNNGASNITCAYATPVAWGSNLDYTTKPTEISGDWPIKIGDVGSKITGVEIYGTPAVPFVMKEDEFGAVNSGIYAPVQLGEMKSVRSADNGRAHCVFGTYLFFSLLQGVERYYESHLDDLGPNRDEGLPQNRRGPVFGMATYPGCIYMTVDAGALGYSCVLKWNQLGYHEMYRAPYGERIRNISIQTIPGRGIGRIWISQGEHLTALPVAINAKQENYYSYASQGNLISSRFNGNLWDVRKFWKSAKLFIDQTAALESYAKIYYRTDEGYGFGQVNRDVSRSTSDNVVALCDLGGGHLLGLTGGPAGACILNSTDSGVTWIFVTQLGTETYGYSLRHLVGSGVVLAGTSGGNVFKSSNYGATWGAAINVVAGAASTVNCMILLAGGKILAGTYTTTQGSIYKSTNGGDSWTKVYDIPGETSVNSLCDCGANVILAGTYPAAHVYRSTDAGDNWSLPTGKLGNEYQVYTMLKVTTNVILAGTWNNAMLFRSTDNGLTWNQYCKLGLLSEFVYKLVLLDNGVILAATGSGTSASGGNLLLSRDKGMTWELCKQPGAAKNIFDILPLGNGVVIASAGYRWSIYRSINSSEWVQITGNFETSPSEEKALISSYNVSGHWWQYKIELNTDSWYQGPVVSAVTVDCITRVVPKRTWRLTFQARAHMYDQWGKPSLLSASQLFTQLSTWANSDSTPAPLLMNCVLPEFDGIRVMIEPSSIQPLRATLTGGSGAPLRDELLMGQLTLEEA